MDGPHLPSTHHHLHHYHAYPPPPPHLSPPTHAPSQIPPYPQQSSPPAPPEAPAQDSKSCSEATDRARAYKSRNKRPCDFCRYKKAACHLESAPPCELCIRYNKECTFVESPAKRRRHNDSNGDSQIGAVFKSSHPPHDNVDQRTGLGHIRLGSIDLQYQGVHWENGMASPGFQMPDMPLGNGIASAFHFDPQLYREPVGYESLEPVSASSTAVDSAEGDVKFGMKRSSVDTTSPQPRSALLNPNHRLVLEPSSGERSVAQQDSSNALIVGMSGDSDPYLLSKYHFDDRDEATFRSVRIRKMSTGPVDYDGYIPAFFTMRRNDLASGTLLQTRTECQELFRQELEDLVNDGVGKRLMILFYRYIQPCFPVLSREDVSKSEDPKHMPPCLLAAIYGHALPYYAWDEQLSTERFTPHLADAVFKIAWKACQSLLHTPDIPVMQTLLLLVQRRPPDRNDEDTPFTWAVMATAVSIAQALGLNRGPTDWPLPLREVKLRKRLAWATFVQDKWLALNSGRSSHIQADDWDVPPLKESDFPDADQSHDNAFDGWSRVAAQHFIKLCELTVIVDDILRDLFSIKATRQLHNSLESTLEVAKPLRIRLTEWYQALPPGLLLYQHANFSNELPQSGRQHDGRGSLQLAYITAKIELFRAMLRPRITDANAAAVTALRTGAVAVAKEITDFLVSLSTRELEAFWASYARTNFTIASSFMLLLFITSPTTNDANECLRLLAAWQSLLRMKGPSCDLLTLALASLEGVFGVGMEKLIELSPAALRAWNERQK